MIIKEVIKKDGSTVYKSNIYLGIDNLTGKKVKTTITAPTQRALKTLAKQKIADFERNGNTLRPSIQIENFESLALMWWDNYKLTVKENTQRITQSFLSLYILPALGKYKLNKITPALLQGIVNKWANNANTAVIKNGRREKGKCKAYALLLNLVKRILDVGFQLGLISSNPAILVKAPRLKKRGVKKLKYFNNKELKKFLAYLNDFEATPQNIFDKTLYLLLLSTGMRIGEALALSWTDIDFDKQTITISKTLFPSGKLQNSPKTATSARVIALNQGTITDLKAWQKKQYKYRGFLSARSGKLFTDIEGNFLKYGMLLYRLNKHFDNASVAHIGFHGFRHTHASLLMNHDVNPKSISERLGHKDISITLNTYSHLAEDKKKETAEQFEKIINNL
ncbi:tyrosine-type recombinase/integrase [Lactococcus nasutitermitis]|uniref:Tyrosine-type recombinase/integrase n=1 Tax=Lactococcus nasutitermitis TaxID=1652957 RepID=A0ABV9JAT5_9LACT|nr:site-specific integrase [Lactococcus nasutitermitis]